MSSFDWYLDRVVHFERPDTLTVDHDIERATTDLHSDRFVRQLESCRHLQSPFCVSRSAGPLICFHSVVAKLLYAGPSIDILTEQYAERGRIDEAAPITLHFEIEIDARVDEVWGVLSDPTGWSAVLPAIHDVKIDSPVAAGVAFSWKNGRAPLIKSRFAVVDDQRELTWVGASMGAKVVHAMSSNRSTAPEPF